MANRSTKGESQGVADRAAGEAMDRGLARLANFERFRGDIKRAAKRVAFLELFQAPLSAYAKLVASERMLRATEIAGSDKGNASSVLGRPLSAHPSRNQWEQMLSPARTGDIAKEPKEALGDWPKKLKAFETALLSQHLDFATVNKDLAIVGWLVTYDVATWGSITTLAAAAKSRGLVNLEALLEPLAKLAGMPLEWAAGPILRAARAVASAGAAMLRGGRAVASASAAMLEAGGAEVSLIDLTAPQAVVPAVAGAALGEGTYRFGIKGSRLETWLASHLHDERSDVHLRKWEMRGGRTNTWHVTHAPQITVVVNGADAAHPRKIAEQMVMALQAHHSELDQKLADAWKRQAVRDERTGF